MTDWVTTFPEPTGEMFLKGLQDRDMLIRAWNAFYAEYPLLVTPMMTLPTVPRAYDVSQPGGSAELDVYGRWGVNLSAIGMPALAYPHGSHEGAPMGVQIAAHSWREDLLLAAGDALEERLGAVQAVEHLEPVGGLPREHRRQHTRLGEQHLTPRVAAVAVRIDPQVEEVAVVAGQARRGRRELRQQARGTDRGAVGSRCEDEHEREHEQQAASHGHMEPRPRSDGIERRTAAARIDVHTAGRALAVAVDVDRLVGAAAHRARLGTDRRRVVRAGLVHGPRIRRGSHVL